jgi:hypothetical protein
VSKPRPIAIKRAINRLENRDKIVHFTAIFITWVQRRFIRKYSFKVSNHKSHFHYSIFMRDSFRRFVRKQKFSLLGTMHLFIQELLLLHRNKCLYVYQRSQVCQSGFFPSIYCTKRVNEQYQTLLAIVKN